MHKRFHLCGLKDQVWVADLIEPVQNLTVTDRNTICSAPASQTDADLWRELMPAARAAAGRLAAAGQVEVTQGGQVVDVATARGPVRIRRPEQ